MYNGENSVGRMPAELVQATPPWARKESEQLPTSLPYLSDWVIRYYFRGSAGSDTIPPRLF